MLPATFSQCAIDEELILIRTETRSNRWMPEMFCVQQKIWNATQCDVAYRGLPACLHKIQLALDQPTDANRRAAFECGDEGVAGGILLDLHGVMRENINKRVSRCGLDVIAIIILESLPHMPGFPLSLRPFLSDQCDGSMEDCYPTLMWQQDWFRTHRDEVSKTGLVPQELDGDEEIST